MTPISESTRCYLVRTDANLVEKSIVGVGWSELNFSSMENAEAAIRAVDACYGIGRNANQIRRYFAIQDGDLIVATLPYSVAIGRATGGLFHDPAYYDADKVNQRRVVFPLDKDGHVVELPRASFSEAFQRRLRVRGITINDLGEFHQEIMDAYEKVNSGKDYSWTLQVAEKAGKATDAFKKSLLQNIQSGRTNLLTGGVGLEHLVKELLQCEGYQAEVLSKHAFPGFADADIKASRSDPCTTVNLLVQVKHHQGFTNEHGLHQLEEIRKHELPEYSDHELIFCTSASTSETFLKRAELVNVTVIDGAALVDWIVQRIDHLSPETKNSLGICEVPTVF